MKHESMIAAICKKSSKRAIERKQPFYFERLVKSDLNELEMAINEHIFTKNPKKQLITENYIKMKIADVLISIELYMQYNDYKPIVDNIVNFKLKNLCRMLKINTL